jgi:DNA-binding NtrC family response regulator
MNRRLLLLEHNSPPHAGFSGTLNRSFECQRQTWDRFDPEVLCHASADVVLAVAPPEPSHCLNFLSWLVTHPLPMATVAVLPGEPADHLLHVARQAADDFVLAPVRDQELNCRLAKILGEPADEKCGRRIRKHNPALAELVGDDPVFLDVLERIPAAAATGAPVLVLGETGTGKEVCAQAIHNLSSRRGGPFVPVECGAIPEHLIENELFGHVRGAFTDAHSDQKGLAGLAEGGTLFLDEVDTLPMAAQAKLLRFLQEGTYRPLGSQRFLRSDLRLIAATNNDLSACIRANRFRPDLYFRLNVLPLHLPPLRERRSDIAKLANHFLGSMSRAGSTSPKTFAPSALRTMHAYNWPGNIRELFNVTQRAVTFSAGNVILPSHLEIAHKPADADAELTSCDFEQARRRVIGDFEHSYVEEMLRKHNGNVTRAAREAGKDRRVFGRLVKKYRIDRRAV